MKFFNRYPKVPYKFGTMRSTTDFTNLSVYADIIDSISDDSSLYTLVDVRDQERPDLLSDRLYDDSSLGWTFKFMNEDLRTGSWPMGYQDFQDKLAEDLPGQCLVCRETEASPTTGADVLQMVSRFNIGSLVYGTNSTAQGTVYARNASLGQIFVNVTSGAFVAGETIQDVIAPATPNEFLTVDTVSLAPQATHHYENTDGDAVDVDVTTGIVPASYTEVTYENVYENKNADLSKVRVLRSDVARQLAIRYREIINS